jgi:hypothetical protein
MRTETQKDKERGGQRRTEEDRGGQRRTEDRYMRRGISSSTAPLFHFKRTESFQQIQIQFNPIPSKRIQ